MATAVLIPHLDGVGKLLKRLVVCAPRLVPHLASLIWCLGLPYSGRSRSGMFACGSAISTKLEEIFRVFFLLHSFFSSASWLFDAY